MLARAFAIAVAVAVLVAATGGVARADNGPGSGGIWGNVNCAQNPYPGCQLGAGSTRSTGRSPVTSVTGHQSGDGSGGSGPAQFSCLDLMPYVPASGPLPPAHGHKASSGAWYVSVCSGFHVGMAGGGVFYPPIWVANGRNQPPPPSPAELARRAENQLALPTPRIVLSPVGQQLVNLPTWLWLAPSGWATRAATASVPGVSVTATARPRSVLWSMGDGGSVTCTGPGTVYTAGDDPTSVSPTCGHTYRTSSAGQPGAVFAVTATVHWSVTWAGAGQGGTFPDLTTAATARVLVAESQALTSH